MRECGLRPSRRSNRPTRKRLTALAQGGSGPLWITAVAQTAGRGRMDRTWVSPDGNLYASLLLSEPSPFERAPELTFVAALALRDAIVARSAGLAPRLAFKWPNDLLLGGEKCAGILIEGEVEPGKSLLVVIGIGVNCATPSAGCGLSGDRSARPRRRCHAGAAVPAAVRGDVPAACAMGPRRRLCGDPRRLALRRARHRRGDSRCAMRTREKIGRFAGLDRSGRLVLERRGRRHRENHRAGDVFPFGAWRRPARSEPSRVRRWRKASSFSRRSAASARSG